MSVAKWASRGHVQTSHHWRRRKNREEQAEGSSGKRHHADDLNQKVKGLLEVHVAVLLFGLAGLFGKLISQPSIVIVSGRAMFAAVIISLLLLSVDNLSAEIEDRLSCLSLLGIILAVHWATFFHSIQVSSVAIGLITFSTFPAFVVFLEPLLFREHLDSVRSFWVSSRSSALCLWCQASMSATT